ncbi:hypothetical protein HDV00_010836 [Rhizophlyctis rosea]|nr:hypothetical protein HDV00_010836 [Rhizophlyctis rosea]
MVYCVYNITSRATLDALKDARMGFMKVVSVDKIPIVVVGNKSDLGDMRQVDIADAEEMALAWGGCPVFEVSACENVNISEAFKKLAKEIVARKQTAKVTKTPQEQENEAMYNLLNSWFREHDVKLFIKDLETVPQQDHPRLLIDLIGTSFAMGVREVEHLCKLLSYGDVHRHFDEPMFLDGIYDQFTTLDTTAIESPEIVSCVADLSTFLIRRDFLNIQNIATLSEPLVAAKSFSALAIVALIVKKIKSVEGEDVAVGLWRE